MEPDGPGGSAFSFAALLLDVFSFVGGAYNVGPDSITELGAAAVAAG